MSDYQTRFVGAA